MGQHVVKYCWVSDSDTYHSRLDLRHPGVVPTLRVGPRLPAGPPSLSRALPHARIPHVHHRQRLLELGKHITLI